MTPEETQRVQEACFGGRQIPDAAPSTNESKRGFFSNTTIGGLGAANNLMDPTMLAVFGIVITLGATMLQMIRGN